MAISPKTNPRRSPAGLSEKLVGRGLRATPRRQVVYSVLLQKRDHPTADEVFGRVKSDLPNISLATVYNCLESLVQADLVRAVNFERGPTRYCPNLEPHAHFHDEKTGRTYDVDVPAGVFSKLRTTLPQGFDAQAVEIIFRGHAPAPANSSRRPASAETLSNLFS